MIEWAAVLKHGKNKCKLQLPVIIYAATVLVTIYAWHHECH
jgi:hypothetical protein